MIITEKVFNVQTGVETITEREETAQEIKTRLQAEAEAEAAQAEAAQAEAARAALLDKLGITADEAALLLG